jgi:DNA polymerase-3 subunit epsilon
MNYPEAKIVVILDFETTGLDENSDQVIEFGAILYSIEYRCILQQISTLFSVEANPAININRINVEPTKIITRELCEGCILQFEQWLRVCDYLIAHNARFDKKWLRHILSPEMEYSKPWLCTYEDFRWPLNDKESSLVTTALNHGIGVSSAHRALVDCQLIAALFDRVEGLSQVFELAIKRSFSHGLVYKAIVKFEERNVAKQQRFQWDATQKIWYKIVNEMDSEDFKFACKKAGLKIEHIDVIPPSNERFRLIEN